MPIKLKNYTIYFSENLRKGKTRLDFEGEIDLCKSSSQGSEAVDSTSADCSEWSSSIVSKTKNMNKATGDICSDITSSCSSPKARSENSSPISSKKNAGYNKSLAEHRPPTDVTENISPSSSQRDTDNNIGYAEPKSPRDITEYLEEAFKEATYCSQKSTDEQVSYESQCAKKCKKELDETKDCQTKVGVKSQDVESICSQSLFDDNEDMTCSGKSLSDIDADVDYDSQPSKSFFKNYKKRIGYNEDSVNSCDFISKPETSDDNSGFCNKLESQQEDSTKVEYSNDVVLTANEEQDVLVLDDNFSDTNSLSQQSTASQSKSDKTPLKSSQKAKSKSSNKSGSKKGKSSTLKTHMNNQTTLFSFFTDKVSQGKTFSNGHKVSQGDAAKNNNSPGSGMTVIKSHAKLVSDKQSSTPSCVVNTTNHSGGIRNACDILMKKSVSEPILDSTMASSKSSLVKNASDILMGKQGANVIRSVQQKTKLKGSWNADDENGLKSTSSTDQTESEASGKPKRYCPFYKKIPG